MRSRVNCIILKCWQEMMDRRKRVERWRREQKRKVMVEIHDEVKDEKRRQRKLALEGLYSLFVSLKRYIKSFVRTLARKRV